MSLVNSTNGVLTGRISIEGFIQILGKAAGRLGPQWFFMNCCQLTPQDKNFYCCQETVGVQVSHSKSSQKRRWTQNKKLLILLLWCRDSNRELLFSFKDSVQCLTASEARPQDLLNTFVFQAWPPFFDVSVDAVTSKYLLALYRGQIWLLSPPLRGPFKRLCWGSRRYGISLRHLPLSLPPFVIMQISTLTQLHLKAIKAAINILTDVLPRGFRSPPFAGADIEITYT